MKRLIAAHRLTFIQFFKFGTIGVIGFIADNALVYLGIYCGLSRIAAGLASFPFVVLLTWGGNRFFTFREG